MPDGWAMSFSNKHPVETVKLFDFYYSPVAGASPTSVSRVSNTP